MSPERRWSWCGLLVGLAIVACSTAASSLALLPVMLIGFVLLLRDVLGPSAMPFGVVISVLSWLSPDWGSRALALSALLRGLDAGLAGHLVRPVAIALAALAPAVAIMLPLRRLSLPVAAALRLLAMLAAAVAMATGGRLVAWLLLPAVCLFAWRAARLTDADAPQAPEARAGPERLRDR